MFASLLGLFIRQNSLQNVFLLIMRVAVRTVSAPLFGYIVVIIYRTSHLVQFNFTTPQDRYKPELVCAFVVMLLVASRGCSADRL